ncbi:hypothetical protein F4826_003812 [Rahnella inusitata]|uniref:hypothetical protein n=1 Tax=Rahnella rivi TaxID=2816249 RepID=UPI0010A4972A|nr:hypothetical protein [Rahnella rivi]MBB6116870.1 hypothetical protein [Rahnella inusitata]MBU9831378.1 hypothetical protein [Rahnella rivi]THD43246.1 hypothetical protein ERD95_21055 [Enterobacteriaceae bacterium ML5]
MIVQFADYAALRTDEQHTECSELENSGSEHVIDLSARRQSAAYKKAMAQVLEEAAKLDW